MRTVLPILLFALGGVLAGGAWSLAKQGAPRATVVIVALIGLLAVIGGVAWIMPGSG